MFGLMKARLCTQPAELREPRRLAYCGTCKVLGARYGQRARFLLNHDTVFLAELLLAMDGAVPPENKALRSYNCLALPAEGDAPLPLRFAAAATLFITEGMLADHRQDTPSRGLDAAARILATPFRKAEADLRGWGAPVDELRALLASQASREGRAAAGNGKGLPDDVLRDVAEPTARGLGLLFEAAARLAGREEAAAPMQRLGEAFGSLVYLLDAFEDEPKDAARGEFNAFRAAFGAAGPLDEGLRAVLRDRVASAGDAVEARIRALPFPEDRSARFALRLRANLHRRLGLGCTAGACACAAMPEGRSRFHKAQDIVAATLGDAGGLGKALLAPLVLVLALPVALLFPAWLRRETRLKDAYGLVLNLMAAGQAARALLRPLRFASEGPEVEENASEAAGEPVKKTKKGGGCGCCDCDC